MEKYTKLWLCFFAVSLIAIAIQQLMFAGFQPVILPPAPAFISGSLVLKWIAGILLIVFPATIIFNYKARAAAVYMGTAFLLLLIFFHIPYNVKTNLHFLGAWGNAFKILAYSGGSFIAASVLPRPIGLSRGVTHHLEKLIPAGRFFFAVTMVVFGIEHFVYISFVADLVPAWIPWRTFWGYFCGVALIAAGLAMFLDIQMRLAATLLGIMIFIWLIVLHIPRAIADPFGSEGNELSSVCEALGFSGIAFLLAITRPARKTTLDY